MPVAAAPGQPVRSHRPQAVLEFDIENVQSLRERSRDIALGVLEIGLNLQLPPPGEVAVPAAEQVVSGDARVVADGLVERAPVGVALQGERVRRGPPVGAKADLALAPAVARGGATRVGSIEDIEESTVDTIRPDRAHRAAIARAQAAFEAARASVRECALGIGGAPRDHVDHPVDGVCAPQARSGAADHLDALDVFQHHVLGIPENAGEKRRVDGASVDEDQQLVGDGVVEAARADGVRARAHARDFQVGREPQRLRKAGRARAADVVPRDHENRRGCIREPLGVPRHRGDLDVAEFLDAQIREVRHAHGLRAGARRGKQEAKGKREPPAQPRQYRASA